MADTSVAQLAEAAAIAGPAIRLVGGDLNTMIAILGGFANANFKGVRGGEALKQVITKLQFPLGETVGAIADLELVTTDSNGEFRNMISIFADIEEKTKSMASAERAAILTRLFGAESVAKFSALMGIGTEKLREFEIGSKDANGSLDIALQQMEGLIDVLKQLREAFRNLIITIGQPLLKPLTKMVKGIKAVIVGFRLFAAQFPGLSKFVSLCAGICLGVLAIDEVLGALINTLVLHELD